jgi:hypothetical protein
MKWQHSTPKRYTRRNRQKGKPQILQIREEHDKRVAEWHRGNEITISTNYMIQKLREATEPLKAKLEATEQDIDDHKGLLTDSDREIKKLQEKVDYNVEMELELQSKLEASLKQQKELDAKFEYSLKKKKKELKASHQ